jgi:hypothetical protein
MTLSIACTVQRGDMVLKEANSVTCQLSPGGVKYGFRLDNAGCISRILNGSNLTS